MRPIQMVDTRSQYLKIKEEVDSAVLSVMDTAAYINGKPVHDFARSLAEYVGVKHVIPCANGTDALQIALMALELQPGDEVITPSFTFIATTEVAALLRLTPVFVEVDAATFCMDPESLKKAITPKTKAIIPVHLYGQAAPMEEILAIAEEYGIPVIEDNAQAIGSDYKFSDGKVVKTGAMGLISATSFYPSKNLGAFGDGGALFTNDDALAHKLKMVANHGMETRYYHDIVGCNSRLDTIQAAILNIKLRYLDEYTAARTVVADYYDNAFKKVDKITIPYRSPASKHVFHQYTIKIDDGANTIATREKLKQYLDVKGIPAMLYYPLPGHRQKMFDGYSSSQVELPVTDLLTSQVLSLPIHTEMDEEQLAYITKEIISFFEN